MNTYLWADANHEYDFIAVNAATLDDAIKLATEVVESEFENKIQKRTTTYSELIGNNSQTNRITKEIKEDCARYINIIRETQPIKVSTRARLHSLMSANELGDKLIASLDESTKIEEPKKDNNVS